MTGNVCPRQAAPTDKHLLHGLGTSGDSVAERIAIYASAWMPTHRSQVERFRFVDSGQLCGISQSHSAGRLSLSSDDDLVTSIIGAVGIPMRAIVAVGCGEVVRQSAVIVGRKQKTASPPEQRAASRAPFHSTRSNGRALLLVVVRDSSIAVPLRAIDAVHHDRPARTVRFSDAPHLCFADWTAGNPAIGLDGRSRIVRVRRHSGTQ